MKLLKIIVVIVLIAASGTLLFFGTLSGEGVIPEGGLLYPNSYPDFGTEYITFAPSGTHNWEGAIAGGINGNASVKEKAAYLFLLASYNERDLPYYAYYLDGSGFVNSPSIDGELFALSYKIVNNTYDDTPRTYSRLINYGNKLFLIGGKKPVDFTTAAQILLNKAHQEAFVGDQKYKMVATSMSMIQGETPVDNTIAVEWNKGSLSQKEYDGRIPDWEDLDITGLSQPEIDFIYKYESRVSMQLLAENIIESATIEEKTLDGKNYWECKIIVDVNVANNNAKTIAALEKSAGFSNMNYNKFELAFEVWDIGVFKFFNAEESWNGSLPIPGLNNLRLPTQSTAPCYYSYNLEDCDLSKFYTDFNLTLPTA